MNLLTAPRIVAGMKSSLYLSKNYTFCIWSCIEVSSSILQITLNFYFPSCRHIYWTDWGLWNQKIERANLDGTMREILVNTGLLYPNGIAVSFEGMFDNSRTF